MGQILFRNNAFTKVFWDIFTLIIFLNFINLIKIVVFYKIWKKCNEIQQTKTRMDFNNKKNRFVKYAKNNYAPRLCKINAISGSSMKNIVCLEKYRFTSESVFVLFATEFKMYTCSYTIRKKQVPFSISKGNGELRQECFPNHLHMGTARMK